nr:TRAP transporter small permease subunit [Thermotoga maritima]
MIVLVFASGVARFLKHPINWAVDMSSFLFAWACFFAVDVAWRENKMMSVDILVKKFSERTQNSELPYHSCLHCLSHCVGLLSFL